MASPDRFSSVELGGPWRAAEAEEGLRRAFAEPALDDDGWEAVPVPGHWRSVPAFAASDGPVLYRRRFEAAVPNPGGDGGAAPTRWWLTFEGLFYQGDVWLDGAYLGDTEGYFVPHTFEVTDALAAAREHVLAVEVACARERDRTAKRNLTGVFQHWDCLDPAWNPGGIWRPVRVEGTGPVRIRSLRVLCREATEERAVVALRASLDTDRPRPVRLRTTVAGVEDVTERHLALGANWVEWQVTVPRPSLWWPRALGGAPLHDVAVTVTLPEAGGAVSHRRHRRVGLRSLAWRHWVLSVNGERLFLKGSNAGPTRMALAEATPAELAGDVGLAVGAGLDLLRVHAHVSRPELYDAADEAGLLLWQDLPLQWGYGRGTRRQAVRQAWAATELLGHHPSVALWCAHNEPFAVDVSPENMGDARRARRLRHRFAAAMVLPTWNKDVLDRSLRRALERADGTRPVVAHSGLWPSPTSRGTDSHLYFGWYHGDERQLATFLGRFPRMARFVSEFGAQAVPASAAFMEPGRWPDLDWEHLAARHGLQRGLLERRAPSRHHASLEAWRDATQRSQAELVKHHVEHLRRLKYRPTGGFAHFLLADAHPAVSWSVLDHRRVPKAAYQALARACAPVIVVADRLPARVVPGQALHLDVHVVSDRRDALEGATVEARLCWPGGDHRWAWRGTVPADDCVRVGAVRTVVPDVAGPLRLRLDLRAGAVTAGTDDECRITDTRCSSSRKVTG